MREDVMVKLHGFRPKLLLLMLASAIFLTAVPAAYAQDSGYVGKAACAGCHQDIAANFAKTLHAKAGYWVQGFQDCESCHGPGAEHASSGDPSKIQDPAKIDRQKLLDLCLGCHQQKGKLVHWDASEHSASNLICIDCHSVHSGYDKLLKAEKEQDVCFRCHGDVKAQTYRASHHPIREGKMTCTSCHNPHGSIAPHQIDANTINDKCYECHAEKRGPFLWEHRPATEDCTICHTPHGSSHGKLLVRKVLYLCQSCHSGEYHPGDLYAINPAGTYPSVYRSNIDYRGLYRQCVDCHSNIHGSNHPSGAFFLR
jgi:DmsE family decaheme c-type cytochrome